MTMPTGGTQVDSRNVDVNLRSNVDDYVTGMGQAQRATLQTASAVDQLDQKVANLGKRIQSGLGTFARWDFGSLAVGTASAATFDKQLGTLAATAAVTRTNFSGIKGAVEGAFTSLPASRTSIIQLIETLNNLGVTSARDLGTLAQTFIKLGYATGEGPNQLAQGLVQLSRLMGTTDAQRIGNYANSLLTVSKNAGVSATGVLDFAQAIAPMARQAGIGEAAVLGISAAFSKAGADGYVAANTFNSIIGNITNLIQSGSPELAKYANLIGVTVGHFRSMDKTTALQDIFSTIAKQGPQAIVTLNRLGIDGVRAQAAIAAVVQSGDLNAQIAQAQGASGNQNNLNRGASAGMNNLADDLARVRNEFTQIGTEIGQTFIGPFKIAVTVVDDLLHALNNLIKPFAPIIAVFAGLAGAIAGVAGAVAGLSHLVLAGGIAALLLRSGPAQAFRGGVSAGRGVLGETEAEAQARLAANPSAVMYAGGRMPLRARLPYVVGRGIGEMRGPIDPNAPGGGPGVLRQAGRFAVRAPGLIVAGVTRSQTRLLSDAAQRDPYNRSAYAGAMGATPRPSALPRTFVVGGGGEATMQAETAARRGAVVSLKEWTQSQYAANKASLENEGSVRALSKTMWDATKAVAQFGVQTARTGASLLTGGRLGGGAAATDTAAVAAQRGALMSGLARGGGLLRSVAGGLGPLGIGLVGASVLPGLFSRMHSADQSGYQTVGENSISKYDQLLGQTSTNLAKFDTALNAAATGLNGLGNQTLAQIGKVTAADRAKTSSGYTVTDKNFGLLAKQAPGNTGAAVSYIQGLAVQHGGMDPKTFNAIKDDLIATYGSAPAQNILNRYLKTGPDLANARVNYGALGGVLQGVSGRGQTGVFNTLAGQVNSAIVAQGQIAPGRSSSRAELNAMLQTFGSALTTKQYGGNTDSIKQVRALLAKNFGGSTGDYALSLGSTDTGNGQGAPSYANRGVNQQRIIDAILRTQQGRAFLTSAGLDPSVVNRKVGFTIGQQGNPYQSFIQGLGGSAFPGPQQNELSQRIIGTGSFGRYAETNKVVQQAYEQPQNAAAQYQAMIGLFQKAGGERAIGTGSTDRLLASFDRLTSIIGDTSDQLYVMSRAAKAYALQEEQYRLPFMSRSAQLGQTARDYRQAQVTQRTAPGPDTAGDLATAKGNYEQQLQAQTQFEIQTLQTARNYGIQMERAKQDENTQIYRSERDFNIQMLQSQEDFQRQMFRTFRDHNRQMAQEAQTSAQNIYNPYQRVQADYTVSSGTLQQNLLDQNTRLRRQKSELDQLKAAGLSLQAIQTLNLADPNNAQNLDRLFIELSQNPSQIAKLNAAASTRVKLTKSLTQSDFNLSFQQTQVNFSQGVKDATKDYNIARTRAVDAQHRSLSDMAFDYNRMVARSAQDLTTAMTELYGTFADNYGRTLAAINDKIGKYAPGIAHKLVTELRRMRREINNAVDTGGGPGATFGSSNSAEHQAGYNPVSRSGTGKPLPHAMGVLSTMQHQATISEGNRPEIVLPLDARGQQFMAGLYQGITSYLVKTISARGYASMPSGSGMGGVQHMQIDQGTYFTGPVSVAANDPNAMARALAAKARIAKLSRPARTAASH